MGEGQLKLNPAYPTVGEMLRPLGYSSLGLSANGMLAPLLSLEGAFDACRWSERWEKTFRWRGSESVEPSPEIETPGQHSVLSLMAGALSRRRTPRNSPEPPRTYPSDLTLAQAVRQNRPEEIPFGPRAESFTWAAIDCMNRIARVLRYPDDPHPLPIAPWIEGTMAAWLSRQPPDRPVHCFVNLLDAHEKYLSDGEIVRGLGSWIRFVGMPQNPRLWLGGMWRPTERELDLLRRLYESSIRILDRRLAALVDVLRRAGRWDNTLLVLTSDHGQAFGEHGDLFHERSPFQPVLQVPLWVRWPGGSGGGQVDQNPVSLTDIAPTLLAAAGASVPEDLSGIALRSEPQNARASPVLAMADGFPCIEHYRGRLSEPAFARLLRSYAVAYRGDFKAVVGIHDGGIQMFDLARDPAEQATLEGATEGDAGSALRAAQEAAARIQRARHGAIDAALEDRLRRWGY